MKITTISAIFILLLLCSKIISGQIVQSAEWVRVKSVNNELSVEIPAQYSLYGDTQGFLLSDSSRSYNLTDIRILSTYREKTLLSLEIYKTKSPEDAADIIADREKKDGKKSDVKFGESKIKQILFEKNDIYAVRRFYVSKDNLYILTAASRNGETEQIKRFLNSVAFKNDKTQIEPIQPLDPKIKVVSIAELKFSRLEIESNPKPFKKPDKTKKSLPKPEKDPNLLPVTLINMPNPSYTNAARQNNETGLIRMRVTFSETGTVSKIGFLSTLNDGLVRQALFAALRLRFLPSEKNGETVSSARILEYSFSIY